MALFLFLNGCPDPFWKMRNAVRKAADGIKGDFSVKNTFFTKRTMFALQILCLRTLATNLLYTIE